METKKKTTSFPLPLRLFYILVNLLIRLLRRRRDGSVNRTLLSLLVRTVPPSPTPDPIYNVSSYDHLINYSTNLTIRRFSPSNPSNSLPVILYFHGGGFLVGSPSEIQFDDLCRRISHHIPAHVVSVDYRLAPEHRFPAPILDGLDVLKWLDSNNQVSSVFISGDSAGGNIAHHLTKYAMNESYERVNIVGVISLQPFFGGEEETESERELPFISRENVGWLWGMYLPEGYEDCDHEVANVMKGELGRFAKAAMVVIGGKDALKDRQREYGMGLRKKGVEVRVVEYEEGIHCFHLFPGRKESGKLMVDLREFVEEQLGKLKNKCS